MRLKNIYDIKIFIYKLETNIKRNISSTLEFGITKSEELQNFIVFPKSFITFDC